MMRLTSWCVLTNSLCTLWLQAVLTRAGFDERTLQALREAKLTDQQIKQVPCPIPHACSGCQNP